MNRIKLHLILLVTIACAACLVPQFAYAASSGDLATANSPVKALDITTPTDTPTNTPATKVKKTKPTIKYKVAVKGKGWAKKWAKAGKASGLLNKYKRLEGIRVSFKDGGYDGDLEYRVYESGEDWTEWTAVSPNAKKIAAGDGISDIEMRLTGSLGEKYAVAYRTHISGLGWQPWLIGPDEAGAIDRLDRIDAIKVKIVKNRPTSAFVKKAKKNGRKLARAHKKFDDRLDRAEEMASSLSSATDYLITVDITNHWLCIFEGSKGDWEMIKNWQVSNGRKGHGTPTGSFTVGDKGYTFGHGYSVYYYTQIVSDYFFHSILYREGTHKVKDGRLGRYISQGCVRMPLNRAKWLQNNMPSGTRIKIYK